jgi:DNA modification methylase
MARLPEPAYVGQLEAAAKRSETRDWEGCPAAFSVELPYRLIKYISRVSDLVLDPF